MEIRYSRAKSNKELEQILVLQRRNLPESISEDEKSKEGFLTVVHSKALLTRMNTLCPHVIAKVDGKVVGYALCMHPSFAKEIEVLKPMFAKIKSEVPKSESYIVMGQICIDKAYRRQGIFRNLYAFMKAETNIEYTSIITEVDANNKRSLAAHYAVGFEDLLTYEADGKLWHLIYMK